MLCSGSPTIMTPLAEGRTPKVMVVQRKVVFFRQSGDSTHPRRKTHLVTSITATKISCGWEGE